MNGSAPLTMNGPASPPINIAVIIPAHNEAKAIGPLVSCVRGLGYDVIVVDDGSLDGTGAVAACAGAVVLRTGQKSGKGNTLRLGFDHALKKGYAAVVAMDGDGQHAPSDIHLFVACFQKTGAPLVNGNRMRDPGGMPFVRRMTNAFMSRVISLICGQQIKDTQCGFRLVSAEVLKSVTLECSDFEIETELLVKAARQGFKIASIDIQSIYRDEKSKIRPLRDTLRFIRYIIGVIFGR